MCPPPLRLTAAAEEESLPVFVLVLLIREARFLGVPTVVDTQRDVLTAATHYFNAQKNPKAAYDILLNALRFRRTAPELQKLYVLQCLKLYLTDFAEEGLQDLAQMTTATDYQAFLKTYQAQRALIEKERESFR